MSKIKELEKALKKAKLEEEDSLKKSELKKAKEWIGKCYSSHLFERVPKPSKEITLRKVTGVKYERERIIYEGTNIVFRLHPSRGIFKAEICEYSTETPFPSWISSFSHEIPLALFDQCMIEVAAHAETYFDKMRALFKQTEYITMGDSRDEGEKIKWLKRVKLIKLPSEGYPNIKDLLVWNNHPFLYGEGEMIYSKESFEIIKDIADEMEKNARSWGGIIWERDWPRVQALNKFYKKHIKDFTDPRFV